MLISVGAYSPQTPLILSLLARLKCNGETSQILKKEPHNRGQLKKNRERAIQHSTEHQDFGRRVFPQKLSNPS